MKKKVIILGGGVAGMSAAHCLPSDEFEVHVYERHSIPGGKARSTQMPGTSINGSQPLPGEHGFRFFPRFYRHVTDTMSEIPVGDGRTALDNLTGTERVYVARDNAPPIVVVDRFPRNLKDVKALIKEMHPGVKFPPGAKEFFAERIWQLMTSCAARRLQDYERVGWWEYIGANHFDGQPYAHNYRIFFAEGFTRTLVAAQPRRASTRTVGDILLQLLFDMILPGESSDRVLEGPTNDVWIDPWLTYLTEKRGVKYHVNALVTAIHCNPKTQMITKVDVEIDGQKTTLEGDYYISAMPVERISALVTPEMKHADPSLQYLARLALSVNWMNGIQYYLPKDVKVTRGHILCLDSHWAITAISQRQFWREPYSDFSRYFDGKVEGILSVDVSDWFKEAPIFIKNKDTGELDPVLGSDGKQIYKMANDCTREEIIATVWHQLRESLNEGSNEQITDYLLANLDNDIEKRQLLDLSQPDKGDFIPIKAPDSLEVDTEPLLVNATGTWFLRPTAYTRIHNFFLAGDFVKTNTDLATMEGANEAARRAVNALLFRAGSKARKMKIWNLKEPLALAAWRDQDRRRFEKGLPWHEKFSIFKLILFTLISFIKRIFSFLFGFL